MHSILFVCHANRVRSPALQAALQHIIMRENSDFCWVESCAVAANAANYPADPNIVRAAKKEGIEIDHISLSFVDSFFDQFDYIFAATASVYATLMAQAPNGAKKKIHMALAFSKRHQDEDIPDPYEHPNGFELCLDRVEDAAESIYATLLKP